MARFRWSGSFVCVLVATLVIGCHRLSESEPTGSTASSPVGSECPPLVHVTPKAAERVRHYAAESGIAPEKLYLRVRVVPGGCQGFMHKLDLEPDVTADDHIFRSGGVNVVAFRRQADMLRGAEVDFVDEDGKQGFKVENPNFKGDCAAKWLSILEKELDVK